MMTPETQEKLSTAESTSGKTWKVGKENATLAEIATYVNLSPAQGSGEISVVSDGSSRYSCLVYM